MEGRIAAVNGSPTTLTITLGRRSGRRSGSPGRRRSGTARPPPGPGRRPGDHPAACTRAGAASRRLVGDDHDTFPAPPGPLTSFGRPSAGAQHEQPPPGVGARRRRPPRRAGLHRRAGAAARREAVGDLRAQHVGVEASRRGRSRVSRIGPTVQRRRHPGSRPDQPEASGSRGRQCQGTLPRRPGRPVVAPGPLLFGRSWWSLLRRVGLAGARRRDLSRPG